MACRLSHSFKDLTLDEVENKLCAQVIEGMSAAEAGVQSEIRAYRSRPPSSGDNDARDKEIRNQLLAAHMQAFLSQLAELCDMMEDNQNKRGLMIIKQAILHLQFLRDPKYFPLLCVVWSPARPRMCVCVCVVSCASCARVRACA